MFPEKETEDGTSKLPLKKRLDKTVKQEDGCSIKEENKSVSFFFYYFFLSRWQIQAVAVRE